MEILIKIGDFVEFNELPNELDYDTRGMVAHIEPIENRVFVDVPEWGLVAFDLDGSSWSHCGAFKREYSFVNS